jgi:hypothetical protein
MKGRPKVAQEIKLNDAIKMLKKVAPYFDAEYGTDAQAEKLQREATTFLRQYDKQKGRDKANAEKARAKKANGKGKGK